MLFLSLLGLALPGSQAQDPVLGSATIGPGGGWAGANGREALITLGQPAGGSSSGGRYRMDSGAVVQNAAPAGSSIFQDGFEE
ncbi:hypothetical protein [Pseudomarimonas salicorniae]|uniref:Uncharacterized protein n=1 Tax=Pseudomarimonas salicorniae TaxID=2933270 RepID=A0ABT0GFZ2_9GAMM|nr:hypothetical protein [Lysobacter sp. CAU 1642]MCK7592935.1 hypothetical protein [Lysobacter sp. CAU 1642]